MCAEVSRSFTEVKPRPNSAQSRRPNPPHPPKVFRAPKRPLEVPGQHDPTGDPRANPRQALQFHGIGSVGVHELSRAVPDVGRIRCLRYTRGRDGGLNR